MNNQQLLENGIVRKIPCLVRSDLIQSVIYFLIGKNCLRIHSRGIDFTKTESSFSGNIEEIEYEDVFSALKRFNFCGKGTYEGLLKYLSHE